MGDVLLALASLARHSNLSMEKAFHDAIERFHFSMERNARLATVAT